MIWDSHNVLFYDRDVGNVSRITLTPPHLNEKLNAGNVTISK